MQSPNTDKLNTLMDVVIRATVVLALITLGYSYGTHHPRQQKEAEHDTYVPYNSDIYCQRGTGYFTIDSVTSTWFDASGLNIKTVSRQYKLPWYCVSMRPVTQPRTDGRN